MNSMHLSDDEVHVHGAPSYRVRAEIVDMTGQRHQGFLAVSPSELARLDINNPMTWPVGTRAVADGSLYSLLMQGPVRMWKRIGDEPKGRTSPPQIRPPASAGGQRHQGQQGQRHPHPSAEGQRRPQAPADGQRRPQAPADGQRHAHAPRGQRWVQGRWEPGANGRMVWVEGHYEDQPGGPRRAPPVARPPAPPPGPRAPVARPPAPHPAPPPPHPAPPPAAEGAPWPPARSGPPSPHRDFDRSYTVNVDPTWGSHVHAVYEDGSIALHDGRTFSAQDVDHYQGDGLIILRDGQQLSPPQGAQPVHGGTVTTWAAPVGVPGPQSAVHNGVTFTGLPPGTIFFDEDHSFGYQTAQGEMVTGYWNPNGTYQLDDPAIDKVREAAAQGAAEGVANALNTMNGSSYSGYRDEDSLLNLLE